MKTDPATNVSVTANAATGINSNLLWQWCQSKIEDTFRWAKAFVSGRFWLAKTTLLCVAFTVLIAGGIGFKTLREGYTEGYYDKIEHPLTDLTRIYEAGGHDAKLNYRLTVPVAFHIIGLRARWALPALTMVAVIAILYLSCRLSYQITGLRIVALFVALEISSTYIGSFGFIMGFDAVALALVALAALAGAPWYLKALLVFAAAFTDERGAVASLFLLPFCADFPPNRSWDWRRSLNKNTIAILTALLLYFLVRFWLHFGLRLGSTLKGVGPGSFARHVKHWHAGTWFALEGGWLFVFLALVSLWLRRQFLRLGVFLIPIAGVLLGGFVNGDLVRTTAYLLPAVFVSLQVLREHETERPLALYAFFAFLVSVVGGNYNVFLDEITWFMPLPVYWLNEDIGALVFLAKNLVGWQD